MEYLRALFLDLVHLLAKITCSLEINLHRYTDDTQLPVKEDDHSRIIKLEAYLCAVNNWMSRNFLSEF